MIRPALLILLSLNLLSCSSQGQRIRHSTTAQTTLHHTRTDSLHSAAWHHEQMWQLQAGRQQVLILPQGDFKYSADSGFEGSAHYVWIDQATAETSHIGVSDSSRHTAGQQEKRIQQAAYETASEQLHVQKKAGELRLPSWWKITLLIALVLSLGWLYRWVRQHE